MYKKEKKFTFLLTGMENNDAAAEKYVRKNGYDGAKVVQYKLEYAVPYAKFQGIAEFERMTQYKPFCDVAKKQAVAIIDLSEWLNHEKEDFLEIFMKYLHDYDWSFFKYEYVFTAGKADRTQIRALYRLASEYLYGGEIVEDRTMVDKKKLSSYLMTEYPINKGLAERLAQIFVGGKLKGVSQLEMIMRDLVERIQPPPGMLITEKHIYKFFEKIENSKLGILYEEEIRKWKDEKSDFFDKGMAV